MRYSDCYFILLVVLIHKSLFIDIWSTIANPGTIMLLKISVSMLQLRRTGDRVLSVQFMESKRCQELYIDHKGSRETCLHWTVMQPIRNRHTCSVWQSSKAYCCVYVVTSVRMYICSHTRKKNNVWINDLFFSFVSSGYFHRIFKKSKLSLVLCYWFFFLWHLHLPFKTFIKNATKPGKTCILNSIVLWI